MFLLGIKKNMTRKFFDDGKVVPVTMVAIPRCVVTQLKQQKTDGYSAVQLACGNKRVVKKPQAGHYNELGNFRFVREFFVEEAELQSFVVGQEIDCTVFSVGQKLVVAGESKGRGFQGVVKRHHFHGSPKSHGHKDQLRKSGSIGAGGVQNVKKGKRMAGHMGSERVTLKNLEVVEVDSKHQVVYIKGAVPGGRNALLELKTQ